MHAKDTIRVNAPVDDVDRLRARAGRLVADADAERASLRGSRATGGPGTIVGFSMRPPVGRPFHATCEWRSPTVASDGRATGAGEYCGRSGWQPWDLRASHARDVRDVETEVVPAGGAFVRMAATSSCSGH